MITQERSLRKPSGGRIKPYRKKKLYDYGRDATLTRLGQNKKTGLRTAGGNEKFALLTAETANVFDPKEKKFYQAKIKTVVESPANRHYVRRNIMTKGTIIETEKGKARVTSRPGQFGKIDAVLIS